MRTGAEFDWKGENNLDVLLERSDLKNPRYVDQEKLRRLFDNLRWVGTGYELIYMLGHSNSSLRPGKRTAVLGLGSDLPEAFAYSISGTGWDYMYLKYGHELNNVPRGEPVTPKFMKMLAADPQIESVLLLIPPELYSFKGVGYESSKVTAAELDCLLENPNDAKKVMLVLGAYDVLRDYRKYKKVHGYEATLLFRRLVEMSRKMKAVDGVHLHRIEDIEDFLRDIPTIKTPKYDVEEKQIPTNFRSSLISRDLAMEVAEIRMPETREQVNEWSVKRLLSAMAGALGDIEVIRYWGLPDMLKEFEKYKSEGIEEPLTELLEKKGVVPVCFDFGLELVRFMRLFDTTRLIRVLPENEKDRRVLWQMGPYLLENLRLRRIVASMPEDNAGDLIKILIWGRDGARAGLTEEQRNRLGDEENYRRFMYLSSASKTHREIDAFAGNIAGHLAELSVNELLVIGGKVD